MIAVLFVLGSAGCDASTPDTSIPVSQPTSVAFEDILTGPPIAIPVGDNESRLRQCRPRAVADALERFLTTAAEGSRQQIADGLTKPFSWIALGGKPWFPEVESYESIAEAADYLASRQQQSERMTLIGVAVYTARYDPSDPHADIELHLAIQAADREHGQTVFAGGKGLLDCVDGRVQTLSIGLYGLEPDIESIAVSLDTNEGSGPPVARLLQVSLDLSA